MELYHNNRDPPSRAAVPHPVRLLLQHSRTVSRTKLLHVGRLGHATLINTGNVASPPWVT